MELLNEPGLSLRTTAIYRVDRETLPDITWRDVSPEAYDNLSGHQYLVIAIV